MNRLKFMVYTLVASVLLILCPIGNPALAKHPDGPIWEITWTDIKPEDQLLVQWDTFRLKLTGNHYMFKPRPQMRGRWGSGPDFKVKLKAQADRLYCGELKIMRGGHEATHGMSLTEIERDKKVILHIYHLDADDACTYQESHGGLAHGEP